MIRVVFLLCIGYVASTLLDGVELIPPPDDIAVEGAKTVKLVLIGMRHGLRNPKQFLKDDPNTGKWGLEGAAELTTVKKQAFSVGKMLRERYGSIIPKFYDPNTVKAMTSSANRCQMTLQLTMAGLFPLKDRTMWNNEITWQPIPYTINNPILHMSAVDECKPQLDAFKPITEDNRDNLVERIEKDKHIMKYIAENTGLNATSLSDMADVADNILVMKMMDLDMPNWVKNPTLNGYNKTTIIKKILTFAETHKIECALFDTCKRMMAGTWLKEVNDEIKDKADKTSETQMVAYTSHTETVLSTMMELGFNVHKCPSSAGFVIEYAEDTDGKKFVRFLYHEPDTTKSVVHHLYVAPMKNPCGTKENNFWCPLDEFKERFAMMDSIYDWKEACNIPTCDLEKTMRMTDRKLGDKRTKNN